MMRTVILSAALLLAAAAIPASAAVDVPAQKWSFSGAFGKYDRPALRRGLKVYREVCASCHSLDLVAFRHLKSVDFTAREIKALAADYQVEDGPNDEGEMFTRRGLPSDYFLAPFPNEPAARAANAGAYPPDLSLMTKARKGGADYLYAVLTGYKDEAPEGMKLADGMSYNEYFPGHQIAMPPPLVDEGVEYADGTKATVAQQAHDVTVFLNWAAQPELEERKTMGIKVLLFLLVLTGMLYALKRKIWSDLH